MGEDWRGQQCFVLQGMGMARLDGIADGNEKGADVENNADGCVVLIQCCGSVHARVTAPSTNHQILIGFLVLRTRVIVWRWFNMYP